MEEHLKNWDLKTYLQVKISSLDDYEYFLTVCKKHYNKAWRYPLGSSKYTPSPDIFRNISSNGDVYAYISHRSLCVGINGWELLDEEPSVIIPFDRGTPTAKLLKHIRSLDA